MKPRRLLPPLVFLMATCLAPAQGFRERVDVELVRIELLATDSHGRPLPDLRPSEIEVRVDGKPVRIESFEAPSRAALTQPAARPAPPGPPTPMESPHVAELAVIPAPSHIYSMAFLVDETSAEASNRRVALGQLFQFLQKDLPANVEALLMHFDGLLRVDCPWTSDSERLRRTAAAIGNRRTVALLGPPGNLTNAPEGRTNSQLETMEATIHVQTSLSALFDALRLFPDRPGRKALFVVTDGGPFLTPSEIVKDLVGTQTSDGYRDPAALRRAAQDAENNKDLLLDSLSWDRTRSVSLLSDIARLALLRGIEIHPVRSAPHDLGGRVRTEFAFRTRAGVGASDPKNLLRDADSVPTTDIAAGQGMEAMAETTGGDAVLSRRMFEDDLRQEVERRDAAYALSFRDPSAGDHRFHRVSVSVTRTGLALRYRRGYRILDAREALVQGAVNRLHAPADTNPLEVRLELDSLGQENGQVVAGITVSYPAPPTAGGQPGGSGEMKIIGTCAVRRGPLSEPFDLSGRAESVLVAGTPWLLRSSRLRLKPGAYRFSFAVRDEQTGITSYLTFDRSLP